MLSKFMTAKSLVLSIAILLVGMAIGDYFVGEAKFQLTYEIITSLALAVFALLFPEVDEFSLRDLFHFKRRPVVEPVSEDGDRESNVVDDPIVDTEDAVGAKAVSYRDVRAYHNQIEARILKHFFEELPADAEVIRSDVRLLDLGEDRVVFGQARPQFDGYACWDNRHFFYEIKPLGSFRNGLIDSRISSKIAAVRQYSKERKQAAQLILVLFSYPDQVKLDFIKQRARKQFSEAISKGILRLEFYTLTDEDLSDLDSEKMRQKLSKPGEGQ